MDAYIHSIVLAPLCGSVPRYKDGIDVGLIRIAGALSATSYERTVGEGNHNHSTWVVFAASGFFLFTRVGDDARRSHDFNFTGADKAFLGLFSVKVGKGKRNGPGYHMGWNGAGNMLE